MNEKLLAVPRNEEVLDTCIQWSPSLPVFRGHCRPNLYQKYSEFINNGSVLPCVSLAFHVSVWTLRWLSTYQSEHLSRFLSAVTFSSRWCLVAPYRLFWMLCFWFLCDILIEPSQIQSASVHSGTVKEAELYSPFLCHFVDLILAMFRPNPTAS
jgi:hypothetical protein